MAIYRRKDNDGNTCYQTRVRDPFGRWFPAATFAKLEDAKRYERELLLDRDKGSLAETRIQKDLTFAQYWEIWAKECRSRASIGWKISQNQMARDYLLPKLGRMRICEIKSQHIAGVLNQVQALGRSPQTQMHVYSVLHKMLGDAVEYFEYLDRSPVLRRDRPRIPRTERDFLSPQETWKLLQASADDFLGPAIWISSLSGLRPSEVQALRWSSVDFERNQILIREAYKRRARRIEPYPKQVDWGLAPMPAPLMSYLEKRRQGAASDAFVAPGLRGGMLKYEILLFGLKRLCREAGIKEVSPHELRHSCTELYVQAGASAEDIRRLLNQSSLGVTMRYIHRTDDRLSAIAARVMGGMGSTPLEPTPGSVAKRPKLRLIS